MFDCIKSSYKFIFWCILNSTTYNHWKVYFEHYSINKKSNWFEPCSKSYTSSNMTNPFFMKSSTTFYFEYLFYYIFMLDLHLCSIATIYYIFIFALSNLHSYSFISHIHFNIVVKLYLWTQSPLITMTIPSKHMINNLPLWYCCQKLKHQVFKLQYYSFLFVNNDKWYH